MFLLPLLSHDRIHLSFLDIASWMLIVFCFVPGSWNLIQETDWNDDDFEVSLFPYWSLCACFLSFVAVSYGGNKCMYGSKDPNIIFLKSNIINLLIVNLKCQRLHSGEFHFSWYHFQKVTTDDLFEGGQRHVSRSDVRKGFKAQRNMIMSTNHFLDVYQGSLS
ncbi:unnamed protein product [Lactuca saligna]|uniref:Uncharacterized protein n=1 Tax=Lactuca saligna TaxID=75948 RepID=A0AA36E8R4_LACSI|nr:unnamed protein product [Lactuca saligna]